MQKISSAEFAHCVGETSQLPPPTLPEIAFAGRSNVGKSSLINRLLIRKALARTSSQPGKTQTLNFYLVNEEFYLVDLPGYGYAKVPHSVQSKWKALLEGYLARREALKGVVLVVDSRRQPPASDLQMFQWLQHYDKPLLVVATKMDKLRQREYKVCLDTLADAYPGVPIIPFSTVKGRGREDVWQQITRMLQGEGRI